MKSSNREFGASMVEYVVLTLLLSFSVTSSISQMGEHSRNALLNVTRTSSGQADGGVAVSLLVPPLNQGGGGNEGLDSGGEREPLTLEEIDEYTEWEPGEELENG
jgi:hypothetical protein